MWKRLARQNCFLAILSFSVWFIACHKGKEEKIVMDDSSGKLDVQIGYTAAIHSKSDTGEVNMDFDIILDGRTIYASTLAYGKMDSNNRDSASGTLSAFVKENVSTLKVDVRCFEKRETTEKVITGDLVTISIDCYHDRTVVINVDVAQKEELEKNGIDFPSYAL